MEGDDLRKFKLVQGVHVADLHGIFESYSVIERKNHSTITVNVSAENIDKLFRLMVAEVRTPGFLLLEHGTNINVENELRKSDSGSYHKDVYYLDGLSLEDFIKIYSQYDELLTEDGEVNYGFGSHNGTDEVFVGPYKVFNIYTDQPYKYIELLEQNGIPRVDHMKTVWDTFTQDIPGMRTVIKINGIDIYEMVEQLKQKGLYLAERRED